MKVIKINVSENAFFCDEYPKDIFGKFPYLLLGNSLNCNNIIILRFELCRNTFRSIKTINKILLNLFISDYKKEFKSCSSYIDFNVGASIKMPMSHTCMCRNSENMFLNSCSYSIKLCKKNTYIALNISKLVENLVCNGEIEFYLTLYGIHDECLIITPSCDFEEKNFIEFRYEEKDIIKGNCECKEVNCNNKEEAKNECKDEDELSHKTYGYFYNDSACIQDSVIVWNGYKYAQKLDITSCSKGIIIREKGLYKVSYGINLKGQRTNIVQPELNNIPIEKTRIEISPFNGLNNGDFIFQCTSENSILSMKLLMGNGLSDSNGIAAYVSIINI